MLPRLHIIICSTRPGRICPAIAKWFFNVAVEHKKFETVLIDLADFNLPLYDEPEHPRLRKYHHEHTKAWSKSVDTADAFVFVTPEYNAGPPPPLVNALNYVFLEWNYKAAGFVSYGGVSAGLKAVQIEKQILTTLKIVPIVEAVMIPMVREHFDKEGRFLPNEIHSQSATVMLNELSRWNNALTTLRALP